jgi:hypothetical protein
MITTIIRELFWQRVREFARCMTQPDPETVLFLEQAVWQWYGAVLFADYGRPARDYVQQALNRVCGPPCTRECIPSRLVHCRICVAEMQPQRNSVS